MCLQIDSTSPSFLVFNVYNNVDNSACDLLASLPPLIPRSMFIGDFNLHHPLWSRDDNLNKQSDEADRLVDLMAENRFGILNPPGEDTFTVYRLCRDGNGHELYTSTLDLAWTSPELTHYISNFQVAKHLCNGSDHFLLLVTISYTPSQSTRTAFTFKEEHFADWADTFQLNLDNQEEIPEAILTEKDFNLAIDNLTGAALTARHATCLGRVKPARPMRWFDSKVREALRDLRKARKRLQWVRNNHNALRYQVARKQFHFQIVVAK